MSPKPATRQNENQPLRSLIERLRESCIDAVEATDGTIQFHGTPDVGWRAAAICIGYGAPIAALRRVWRFNPEAEPSGPSWEITLGTGRDQ